LKASAPSELKAGERRTKLEQSHVALIIALEGRIEAIDIELAVSIFPMNISILGQEPENPVDKFFYTIAAHLIWIGSLTVLTSECKKCGERSNSATLSSHRLKSEKHGHGGKPRNQITCMAMISIARQVPRNF